jgi:hypothetical protein
LKIQGNIAFDSSSAGKARQEWWSGRRLGRGGGGGSYKSDGKKGSASGKGDGKSGDEGSDKKNEETG